MPARSDDRRFTDKPELDPAAVRSLPANHPAMVENRTLFPSTVVTVDEAFTDRLLVSGKNNRKLGERILKGKFQGYSLYGLSLEERATCPVDCDARGICYGNGMQMARRHRIAEFGFFADLLEDEIREILTDADGLMVRLHVLGDFSSVEYVAMWADLLEMHERLACYGYTHRRMKGLGGDEIGEAIFALKGRFPDRFRIRWSSDKRMPDGTTIIARMPEGPRVKEGIVCPAQTDATACCASCGLCWDMKTQFDTIVFVKHGPKSLQALAESVAETTAESSGPASENVRPVAAISVPQKRDIILSAAPEMRRVAPTSLKVEPQYQRDLSGKSMRLIRKIVTGWDWAKFKPPVCAQTDGGLFIIDGQHTAIAAASRPEIKQIPVMVVPADRIERRAEAFVAHNRDRMTMTPAQILYGDAASGQKEAVDILRVVARAGAEVPRLPVNKNYAKPGQITAVGDLRKFYAASGAELVGRSIQIAVASRVVPITSTVVQALRFILTEQRFKAVAELADSQIADALASLKNLEATSQHFAAETGQSRFRAAAAMIARAAGADLKEVA